MTTKSKISLIEEYLDFQQVYQTKYGNDTIVLMEVGSFFELYEANGVGKAKEVADILNIILTKKNKNIKEISVKNPLMAGIPSVSLDKHLNVLSSLNKYTIVLVTQVTPTPNVIREVTEILSPGTKLNSFDSQNNFLFSCFVESFSNTTFGIGITTIDVSTGESYVFETTSTIDNPDKPIQDLTRFLVKYNPAELIITFKDLTETKQKSFIDSLDINHIKTNILNFKSEDFKIDKLDSIFSEVYDNESMLSGFELIGLEKNLLASFSLANMISFLNDHNPVILKKIKAPLFDSEVDNMILSNNSLFQLDIINDKISSENNGSLFSFLDKTKTAMGSRLLKNRLINPSINTTEINRRLSFIDSLSKKKSFSDIRESLAGTLDLERLLRKLAVEKIEPKELSYFIESLLNIDSIITRYKSSDFSELFSLSKDFEKMNAFFNNTFFVDDLHKYHLNDISESIFLPKINNNLDILDSELKTLLSDLNTLVSTFNSDFDTEAKLEQTDKEGFFLTLTNSKLKNTNLSNNSDFIVRKHSNKAKLFSTKISSLSNKILVLKQKLAFENKEEFIKQLNLFYLKFHSDLENIIYLVADLDVACSNSYTAERFNYKKPFFFDNQNEAFFAVENLRHPLVEQICDTDYVSNDFYLDSKNLGKIIFGVNATGKSTNLKSCGLAIVMAQAGMFVAGDLKISPFSSVFTRITGDDNIFKNQSTFTVEMIELKQILEQSDSKSIVLADELSHGTETNSGVSILSASIRCLTDRKAKFLFTTHLHQLAALDSIQSNELIELLHLSVDIDDDTGDLIYGRKLTPGAGKSVYGLTVAKGLGLPQNFISLAESELKQVLGKKSNLDIILEAESKNKYNSKKIKSNCEICGSKSIDTHHIEEQKDSINGFTSGGDINRKSNLVNVCKSCHNDIHNGIIFNVSYKQTSSGKKLFFQSSK
jgi:DNA mismatch repair protein MutS